VNQFEYHMHTSETLRKLSPVLLSISRCSQPPLELRRVLSDSARWFPGAPESTCSYEGAFRMQWDLTIRVFNLWSCGDLATDLRVTSRGAVTSAIVHKRLQKQLRPRQKHCARLDTIFLHQWFLVLHHCKTFCLSYSSLLQSQDLVHHYIACII